MCILAAAIDISAIATDRSFSFHNDNLTFDKMANRLTTAQKRGGLALLVVLICIVGWRLRVAYLADQVEAPGPTTEELAEGENAPQGTDVGQKGAPAAPTVKIDLNAADSAKLREVKGIGAKLAPRIIRYRELIGGYYDPEQLMQVYGISPENFLRIEPQVMVDTAGKAFQDLRAARRAKDAQFASERPQRRYNSWSPIPSSPALSQAPGRLRSCSKIWRGSAIRYRRIFGPS